MVIRRDMYLGRVVSKMNNGMIKVVTGIRRCGKSFLLFRLFVEYLKEKGVEDTCIIQIPLDDEDFAVYRDPGRLYQYIKERIKVNDRQYYVLIDEAQFAISRDEMRNPDEPIRLYGILNGLLRRDNVDVYVTGSNSKFLSTDVMTEFRGRGDEIRIAPLSFSEYMSAYRGDKYEGWREYMLYGGLPHILAEEGDAAKAGYLKHLNSEIYLKDIVERYELKNAGGMEEVMKILASSIGSLSNAQKIADTFQSKGQRGVSQPTISNYFSQLREAFVIEKAERYDIKGRKYISTPSKYYYTDLGLRNALLNFRQIEETHIMENIIYNELVCRGYNVDVGVVELSELSEGRRMMKKLEIDFVANLGSKRYYIQSTLAFHDSYKKEQEQRPLLLTRDGFKKIIVTRDAIAPLYNEEGVLIMNVFDFLLNKGSLDM